MSSTTERDPRTEPARGDVVTIPDYGRIEVLGISKRGVRTYFESAGCGYTFPKRDWRTDIAKAEVIKRGPDPRQPVYFRTFRLYLAAQSWRPDNIGDLAREAAKNPKSGWVRMRTERSMRNLFDGPFNGESAITDAWYEFRQGICPKDSAPFPIAGSVYLLHDGSIATVTGVYPDGVATWGEIARVHYDNADHQGVCSWGDVWHRTAQGAVLLVNCVSE